MNRIWLFGTSLIIGLSLALLGSWWLLNRNYQYQGVLIDPPVQAADFNLTDQDGQPYRLSDQRGKVVLVYFGYTNCPDVCPITLSDYKRIKAGLGKQAEQVQFVLITVDPERDTVARLKSYLVNFDPGFIGLTGSQADLEPVWDSYGVYQEKQDVGSAAGYLVDHTSRIYTIDPQGHWRVNYPFGMETDKIVNDVKHLLR